PLALAVLVGYLGAVGLPMVDAGMGLKTGWLIRGKGADADFERYGRRQQIFAKYFGVLIGIGMAVVFGAALLRAGNIPPMSIFYGAIIDAGASRDLIGELAIWAVPGAILQAVFGSKSVGMMIATGLLINNPAFGIGILAALSARLLFGTKHMQIRGPGLIAGDGLFGFLSGALRIFF
ncbi:MAG: peptide transporter, partial [Defluviitaleaceae bacterium]|nr:peptide transporter [Defluviitaleaceae bacterium]